MKKTETTSFYGLNMMELFILFTFSDIIYFSHQRSKSVFFFIFGQFLKPFLTENA